MKLNGFYLLTFACLIQVNLSLVIPKETDLRDKVATILDEEFPFIEEMSPEDDIQKVDEELEQAIFQEKEDFLEASNDIHFLKVKLGYKVKQELKKLHRAVKRAHKKAKSDAQKQKVKGCEKVEKQSERLIDLDVLEKCERSFNEGEKQLGEPKLKALKKKFDSDVSTCKTAEDINSCVKGYIEATRATLRHIEANSKNTLTKLKAESENCLNKSEATVMENIERVIDEFYKCLFSYIF